MTAPNGMAGVSESILSRLVTVETKLDMLIANGNKASDDVAADLKDHEHRGEEAVRDHETRIRRLERGFWVAVGASAAIGSAAGSIVPRLIGVG